MHTHSISHVLLTVLDLAVVFLMWREYQSRKQIYVHPLNAATPKQFLILRESSNASFSQPVPSSASCCCTPSSFSNVIRQPNKGCSPNIRSEVSFSASCHRWAILP